jgi:hypothetical protein
VVDLARHNLAGTAALHSISAVLDSDPDLDISAAERGGDFGDVPMDFWEARSMVGLQAAVGFALADYSIRSMP